MSFTSNKNRRVTFDVTLRDIRRLNHPILIFRLQGSSRVGPTLAVGAGPGTVEDRRTYRTYVKCYSG